MQSKQTMKRLTWVALLALILATASSTMAAPPAQAPDSVVCGDAIYCSTGGNAVYVRNTGTGPTIYGENTSTGDGLKGRGNPGVYGFSFHAAGVRGKSNQGIGVKGESVDKYGVAGYSGSNAGVYASSVNGVGLYAHSNNGRAIYVPGAGVNGLHVASAGQSGIRVESAGWDGIEVNSANWSGIWVQSSGADGIRVQSTGQDGLRFFEGVGRDYIRAGSDADLDFRVLGNGEVRSDVGFFTPASDFAEMMDVEEGTASYEPGDVLVVSDAQDRAVELSSAAYSRAVIGVYSTQPGFVGGQPVSDAKSGSDIPVAMVGIVPCKVSAENGAIHRGDLLVTSATPGRAMRAEDPPPGTILGKALEALDEDTGLILVLVTLQ